MVYPIRLELPGGSIPWDMVWMHNYIPLTSRYIDTYHGQQLRQPSAPLPVRPAPPHTATVAIDVRNRAFWAHCAAGDSPRPTEHTRV